MYIYHSTVSKHSLSYISESENLNSSNLKMIFLQQDVFTNLIICWFLKTQLYNKNTFTNLCVRLLNFKKLYIERQRKHNSIPSININLDWTNNALSEINNKWYQVKQIAVRETISSSMFITTVYRFEIIWLQTVRKFDYIK